MVDRVRKVEFDSFMLKHHQNIAEGMRCNVEITWNAVNFEIANHLATLFFIVLSVYAFFYRSSPVVLLANLFNTNNPSVLIQSLFVQLTHHICFVSTQDVLNIQRKNITRHSRKSDVNVYWYEVIPVTRVYYQLCF